MCDYPHASVYSETQRKARKAHHCCICRCEIPKREVYISIRGLWDGHWSTFEAHEECLALYSAVERVHECQAFDEVELCLVDYHGSPLSDTYPELARGRPERKAAARLLWKSRKDWRASQKEIQRRNAAILARRKIELEMAVSP